MKNFLKKDEGFTLIELMVVVAIIGVLSAIAVPNFKKYQAKAKQSEAKIQLAAVYSVEVTARADFDTFGTCLELLGYDKPARGYYTAGFKTSHKLDIAALSGCSTANTFVSPTTSLKAGTAVVGEGDLSSAQPTDSTFTASAAGSVASGSGVDKWTITDTKELKNSTPSI